MKSDKKRKTKFTKSPMKQRYEDEIEATRLKSLKALDNVFEEKTREEIQMMCEKQDMMSVPPLALVASLGHMEGLRKLIDAKVDLDYRDVKNGDTALTLSARSKQVAVVELLLKNNADITRTNKEGDNAFMVSIKAGDPNIVNMLWTYRGHLNINHKNKNLVTALHFAAEKGWESCVQFLIMQGAQVNAQDKNGSTPLIVASLRGYLRTVEVLVKSGCDPLVEDNTGSTAVCRALQNEKQTIADFFLQKFTPEQADSFVKARTDALRKPVVPNHEIEYFYKELLLPILKELGKTEKYRELMFRHKVIPHTITSVGSLATNPIIMISVCEMFSYLLFDLTTFVEERFVLQFIRSGGPELIVRALKSFIDSKSPNLTGSEAGICFLPMLSTCEVPIGREWLLKNCLKVTQFTRGFELSLDSPIFKEQYWKDISKLMWTRFCDYFDDMIRSQCEYQEAQLLKEEEREKLKKEKKREKKRQRRHNKVQVKSESEGDDDNKSEEVRVESTTYEPMISGSEEDVDNSVDSGIGSDAMESMVQKMKNLFANPDLNTQKTEKVLKSKKNGKTATIGEPVEEGNRNASCIDGEGNTEQKQPQKPLKDKAKKDKTSGPSDKNELQQDGMYATEGFFDPSAVMCDVMPFESSWVKVGGKKNVPRIQEKPSKDASSTATRKPKKKQKKSTGMRSTTTAHTPKSKATSTNYAWNNMQSVDEFDLRQLDAAQVFNYEDEFPSLTPHLPSSRPQVPNRAVMEYEIQAEHVQMDNQFEHSHEYSSTSEEASSEEEKCSEQDSIGSLCDEPIPEWASELQDMDFHDSEEQNNPAEVHPTFAQIADSIYSKNNESSNAECLSSQYQQELNNHVPIVSQDHEQLSAKQHLYHSSLDNIGTGNTTRVENKKPEQYFMPSFHDTNQDQVPTTQNPHISQNSMLLESSQIPLPDSNDVSPEAEPTQSDQRWRLNINEVRQHQTSVPNRQNVTVPPQGCIPPPAMTFVNPPNASVENARLPYTEKRIEPQETQVDRCQEHHIDEEIQNATALCAQQIATLAGLRHQKSLIDKQIRNQKANPQNAQAQFDFFQNQTKSNFDENSFVQSTFPQFPREGLSTEDGSKMSSPLQFHMEDTDEEAKTSESDTSNSFPEFHSTFPEEWPFAKPDPSLDPLEAFRLEQVRQWRKHTVNPDDIMSNDYQYYYSSLSERAKSILDNECQNVESIAKMLNSVVSRPGFKFNAPVSTHLPNEAQQSQDSRNPPENNFYNGVRWTSKSPRWRKKFQELLECPGQNTRVVGSIRIPNDPETYCLRKGNSSTCLGILFDGTEVAVTKMRLDQLPSHFTNLNMLLSEDADHLFLVKYLAIEQRGQFCYMAKELCEYTLEEYVRILHLNRRLDPLCADRLVWQLLKGLKHLHDICKMAHHNLRPTNILVDKSGKIKLADFGHKHSALERNLSQTLPELDRRCWLPCEVLVSNSDASFSLKSDVQVAGMLIYYILSGGNHPFGKSPYEIEVNICRNWHQLMYISEEANDMVLSMLAYTPLSRPTVAEALRHPYFWSEEKRFRFLLIVGSDILKELKGGAVATTVTDHVNIIYGPAVCADWMSLIDHQLIQEMLAFRQYRNSIPELVLFLYNCCLHFDKLSPGAQEILDDPCKYFNSKFPTLFMAVYRMLRTSESVTTRKSYTSFF